MESRQVEQLVQPLMVASPRVPRAYPGCPGTPGLSRVTTAVLPRACPGAPDPGYLGTPGYKTINIKADWAEVWISSSLCYRLLRFRHLLFHLLRLRRLLCYITLIAAVEQEHYRILGDRHRLILFAVRLSSCYDYETRFQWCRECWFAWVLRVHTVIVSRTLHTVAVCELKI